MLHLPAAMAGVTLVVAVVAGELFAVPPLVVTGGVALLLGQGLYRRFGGGAERETGVRTALGVVAAAWLVTGLLASGVLWGTAVLAGPAGGTVGVYRDPLNALFEGVSGVTSTGLTVAAGLESQLPATIQWWRSLLQWVGAVGVIVFTLAVTSTGAKGPLLLEAATRPEMLGDDVRVTARRIWALYAGMTAAAIAALWATGIPAWHALNHGLTAIATGGFTITDDSFGAYGALTRVVGALLLVMGAVSFVDHYQLVARRRLSDFLRSTQLHALGVGLAVGIPLLAVVHVGEARDVDAVDTVFQWVTALATGGFSTVDLETWGPGALLLLIAAMVVGGASGSTTGGMKLSRVTWLVKALATRIRTAEPGHRESIHRWDGREVAAEHSRRAEAHAGGFALLWLATLLAGAVLLSVLEPGALPHHVLFDVTSALSNVGLDTGVVGRDLTGASKVVLTVLMFLGRLEILGIVVLLRAPFVPRRSAAGHGEAAEDDRPETDGTDAGEKATTGPHPPPEASDETASADAEPDGEREAEEDNPEAEEDVGPEHPPPGA